ncbi:MAG TPA: protein phosphatase 2C domain-containing protein [Burkholderiales bacterium]
MKFAIGGESRRGGRRANEDRIGYWRSGEALLMVVADGLGGHAHGEVAAQMAVDHLGAAFAAQARPKLANPAFFLMRAVDGAHAAIVHAARSKGMRDSPRTCIAACVIQDGRAHWTHIGDCRLYIVRGGRIVVRTRDHSVVQKLVDEGRIREEAAASHPERNRLFQCLGGIQQPQFDAAADHRLEKGDLVLLCSDGFWGPLTQRQLIQGLAGENLEQQLAELSDLAEARGGPQCDNVSAVAMRWRDEALATDDGSPRTVPQAELATNVQDFTATDPDFLRMSDEDIDKAIAEIKAALRRNALG